MMNAVIVDPCNISLVERLPDGEADLLIVIVPNWCGRVLQVVAGVACEKVKSEGGQLVIANSMPAALEVLET